MAKGQVVDETGRRIDANSAFRAGACIFYYRELENEKTIPFREQVLYQDEHILVADKPHFLPVIPRGNFSMKRFWSDCENNEQRKTWRPSIVSIAKLPE